ncbi:MAG: AbrB/MazE/SpoVT family DNA-binding domain-containing protein [Clostridia bacterium]|nr:AbrB/MazE/SpoVT family DNA-binding domain-containing protein [Clostridia bacterium]
MVKEEDKFLFGICKVGERGQIVIPKDAREVFNISPGDSLIVLGDKKKGLALVKAEEFRDKLEGED